MTEPPARTDPALSADAPALTRVALFAGCFELFNDPAAGRALVRVLAALGCEVILPMQRCCGLPALTAGNRNAALRDMHFNVDILAPLVAAGYAVVSGCPSCTLSLKEDYPDLLPDEPAARAVARAASDAHAFVERLLDRRPDLPVTGHPFARLRLAYHSPCHLRALGQGSAPIRLLEKAGALKFALANTTCCGMGGTFGMKDKNLDMSMAIGDAFFRRVKEAGIEAVVTPCGMCKTQIEGATALRVYHPMELLAGILAPQPASAPR